jgi:thioredoxin-dependent peroxiredoxin
MLSSRHGLPLSFEGISSTPLPRENPPVLTAHSQPPCARLVRRKATVEIERIGGEAIREERSGEAFAGTEQLTVQGPYLHPGEAAPDFSLDYLDLVDMVVRPIHLADLVGIVCLLNVVNSLERPLCQLVTRRWEALCAALPSDACIYTVSMDSPQMQARWQESAGVLHQALSAHRSEQFGQEYGVWLKEWSLLQRAVFVIDHNDHIVYTEYVADQLREPDYAAAMQAVELAAAE